MQLQTEGRAKNIFLPQIKTTRADLEISRTTSSLTPEKKWKFTTLLCAPPQIFAAAERTRSDLAISPTTNMLLLQLIPLSLR